MTDRYFFSRKSCRNFRHQKIDSNTIENIIYLASKAPTCGNMQLYSVVITRNEDNLEKLSELHFNQPAASTAPVILTICADFARFTQWCQINKADAGYDNFHSFITAMTDAVIFAQQIVTIAELHGFGSCYLGTVTYNAKQISQLLKLPDLVVPVAAVSIGIPDIEGEKTNRLPAEAIIHEETYHNKKDEDIALIYKIHDDDIDNQKFIKENNKKNLAQVFAEVRYPRSTNEEVSHSFMQLLKEKGFLK